MLYEVITRASVARAGSAALRGPVEGVRAGLEVLCGPGATLTEDDLDFPSAAAGLEGVRFIGKCVESSKSGAVWVEL